MPFFNNAGCKLYYEFDLRSSQPVLMLSNSLGTHLGMWEPQLTALRSKFSLLRYDTRGHGLSTVPPGPYTLDQLGADAIALLDFLRLSRIHFCGLSLGGMIGQWLAIHASHRIDRLCLCNTAAKIGTPETWNQRIQAVAANGMKPIVSSVLDRWFTADFRASHELVLQRIEHMLLATDPAGYAANCAAIRDADLRARLPEITAPTFIIYGHHDPATTAEDAEFLRTTIAGTRSLGLEAAHLSNIEAAERFNDALLNFFSTEPRQGSPATQ